MSQRERKRVAARPEVLAQRDVVVDLAVEGDLDAAVLVAHRLPPGGAEIDDGEAAVAEDDAAVLGLPQALVVGSAVAHGVAHGGDSAAVNAGAVAPHDADYPAHGALMPARATAPGHPRARRRGSRTSRA